MFSLFTDLNKFKYLFSEREDYYFCEGSGEFNAVFIISKDAEVKMKIFEIIGTKGNIKYDKRFGIDFNNQYFYFDENNNIDYSIQKFIKILHGEHSNSEVAMQITEIIENGLSSM
jgi:hypothetical protein